MAAGAAEPSWRGPLGLTLIMLPLLSSVLALLLTEGTLIGWKWTVFSLPSSLIGIALALSERIRMKRAGRAREVREFVLATLVFGLFHLLAGIFILLAVPAAIAMMKAIWG